MEYENQISPFSHSKDLWNHPEQSSLHWTRRPFCQGQQGCPTLPLALPADYYMTANIINNSQARVWPNVQHYKYQSMIGGLSQWAALIIEVKIHFYKLVNCWCIILHLTRKCFLVTTVGQQIHFNHMCWSRGIDYSSDKSFCMQKTKLKSEATCCLFFGSSLRDWILSPLRLCPQGDQRQ